MILTGIVSAAWMVGTTMLLGLRHDWHQLSADAMAETLAALVGVAGLACLAGLARGKAMVGATSEALLAVVLGFPLFLILTVLVVDLRGPGTATITDVGATLTGAVNCQLLVLGVASPLIGLGRAATRGLTLARPALSGACLGLGAASWAHAVVRIHCPAGGAGHALIAHLLPAAVLMALGAWAFTFEARSDRSKAPGAPPA